MSFAEAVPAGATSLDLTEKEGRYVLAEAIADPAARLDQAIQPVDALSADAEVATVDRSKNA